MSQTMALFYDLPAVARRLLRAACDGDTLWQSISIIKDVYKQFSCPSLQKRDKLLVTIQVHYPPKLRLRRASQRGNVAKKIVKVRKGIQRKDGGRHKKTRTRVSPKAKSERGLVIQRAIRSSSL